MDMTQPCQSMHTRYPFLIIAAVTALLLMPTVAMSSENIRVAIADNQRTVTLRSLAGLVVDGHDVMPVQRALVFRSASAPRRPVRVRSDGDFIEVNGKGYRGVIELRKKKNGLLLVINDLDIEAYLLGVIAAEIPHDWHVETLKAQAIASRTYALYQKRAAGGKCYHIESTENSQMYHGRSGERKAAVQAVRDTEGQVIVYGGLLIQAFYHSSCGGHTEDASLLWDIDEPYLKGVDCECQEISKYGQWERRFSLSQIEKALRSRGFPVRQITATALGTITPAGRVKDVTIGHTGGTIVVPAEALRAAVGNALIPSVFFDLSKQGDELIFSGRGMGHGVGLCQWGAEEMARRKYDHEAILKHYYPGTTIARIDEL